MIAVIFTDLDHMIIPDKLVVAGALAAVLSEALQVGGGQSSLLSVAVPGTALHLPRVVAGGGLGVVGFVLVRALSQLLFRREGMGLGDVKLAGAIGAMLGPVAGLLSFGLAVLAGAVLGLLLLVLRLRRRMEYLPFGPFLAVAALVALVAPQGLPHAAAALYHRWLLAIGLSPTF
jgi:leader peptidase (prepilin peptidase)/N-methyltransferase